MKKVVIGFLGTVLDRRGKDKRWESWRPSVAVCQHEDLLVDRFHLLCSKRDESLAWQVAADIEMISPETEVLVEYLEFKNPWDFEEVFSGLLSYSQNFDFREDEEYLMHITTGTHVTQICVFLLTEAGFFPARLLQTGPGRHNQPPGSYEVIDLDLSRYDSIARRFAIQTKDDISFLKSGINTRNAEFNKLIAEVERVALRSDAPILLAGPTGAGKSRLARQIYELRRQRGRVRGRFVEVNCATLRGDMAMSVLFGHKKGAYTGATESREGLLKAADKGILFLDEIGELGLDEQAMLLRAIEEKLYLPVGADKEMRSDFQLITGTNRNLKQECQRGRFRQDLLARIKFWEFTLPGLKERPQDIEPNIDYELQLHSQTLGKPVSFSSEARKAYVKFALSPEALWVANFRDLNSSLSRMMALCEGNRIGVADVENEMARLRNEWRSESADSDFSLLESILDRQQLAEIDLFDRLQLAAVIKVCRNSSSLAEAGRKLFAGSLQKKRSTNDSDRLRKYLQRFGISWKDIASHSITSQ
ncbi:MAG: Transcriptional regulatory protein RtcR [Candidatus Rifleibacterium amylolyticum]|nr:MAG: Transcriptional regulatory protein RtcR [Candidatus Rifleibacterium amylolyticum]